MDGWTLWVLNWHGENCHNRIPHAYVLPANVDHGNWFNNTWLAIIVVHIVCPLKFQSGIPWHFVKRELVTAIGTFTYYTG